MASQQQKQWSPLLVKSRPPSLVVDRFHHPASEDDLRLAASTHLAADETADRDAVDAKLAATRRELRDAARAITHEG
ncbi:MAG: hypothetical protein ACE367_07245 [Acidimicrobiales bacterium]